MTQYLSPRRVATYRAIVTPLSHYCRTGFENGWFFSNFWTWRCRIRTAIVPHLDLKNWSDTGRESMGHQ